MQQYARDWDACATYVEVLAVLERGEQPTVAQLATPMRENRVVTYLLQQAR